MSWRAEWSALSNRIAGLLEAGRFHSSFMSTGNTNADPVGILRTELLPHSQRVFSDIVSFQDRYGRAIPKQAADTLQGFIGRSSVRFNVPAENQAGPELAIQWRLTTLASFQAEFSYHLSDFQAVARRLSERAFAHLQRSIVADPDIARKWQVAYAQGEVACERLGAAHLLLHGIWAFKANSQGERTDLLLGDRLDSTTAETAADALVLTEWKKVDRSKSYQEVAANALRQAQRYSSGSLAGFELAGYRYLVLVSEDFLPVLQDHQESSWTYRHINIAINPRTPGA